MSEGPTDDEWDSTLNEMAKEYEFILSGKKPKDESEIEPLPQDEIDALLGFGPPSTDSQNNLLFNDAKNTWQSIEEIKELLNNKTYLSSHMMLGKLLDYIEDLHEEIKELRTQIKRMKNK